MHSRRIGCIQSIKHSVITLEHWNIHSDDVISQSMNGEKESMLELTHCVALMASTVFSSSFNFQKEINYFMGIPSERDSDSDTERETERQMLGEFHYSAFICLALVIVFRDEANA